MRSPKETIVWCVETLGREYNSIGLCIKAVQTPVFQLRLWLDPDFGFMYIFVNFVYSLANLKLAN